MANDISRSSDICLALMRLGTRMAAQFDHWFAEQGITQAQFRVLLAVWQLESRQGGATPSALAEYLFIERPTVTVLIARLVERGFIGRVPDPDDGRSHRLHLTETGGKMLREIGPLATGRAAYTLAPFSPEEQEVFHQLLIQLETHLRSGDFS